MISLSDIMALLDRWEVWRQTRECAAQVPALERRLAELEQKLNGPWPPDVCRHCGERALRLGHSRPLEKAKGVAQRWDCSACHQSEWRTA